MTNPIARVGSLSAFRGQKAVAVNQIHKLFECECADLHITKRTVKGGSIQYVYQCLRCGEPKGSAIKHADVARLLSSREPPIFDSELMEIFRRRRSSEIEAVKQQYSDSVWWSMYDAYLRSNEWQLKRRAVLKKSPLCEGCGQERSSEVHHKTYQHVGNEFLWELVAVCHACHKRVHHGFRDDDLVNEATL